MSENGWVRILEGRHRGRRGVDVVQFQKKWMKLMERVACAMLGTLLAPVFDVNDGKMNVGSAEL